MSDTTITSANASLILVVAGLFPAPVEIKGFASDRAFLTDQATVAQTEMGVDGRMTAGHLPVPSVMTISLQADSPSRTFFSEIDRASKVKRDIFYINGTISIPGTGEVFALTRGVMTQASRTPNAQKVLQAREWQITWESITPSLV